MRVLIAEDEVHIAKALKLLLEKNSFTVDLVHDGISALDYSRMYQYDVIALDIMMPGMDGLEVLRNMRNEGNAVPVLFLTAKAEVEDRVAGLNAGADDYLPKPFALTEFLARIHALSRRSRNYTPEVITFGNLTFDTGRFCLSDGSQTIRLNNKEFQVMELLLRYPGQVLSSEQIMSHVWGSESESDVNVIWTYIGFLRRKLNSLHTGVVINTVRGAGYTLEDSWSEK